MWLGSYSLTRIQILKSYCTSRLVFNSPRRCYETGTPMIYIPKKDLCLTSWDNHSEHWDEYDMGIELTQKFDVKSAWILLLRAG